MTITGDTIQDSTAQKYCQPFYTLNLFFRNFILFFIIMTDIKAQDKH